MRTGELRFDLLPLALEAQDQQRAGGLLGYERFMAQRAELEARQRQEQAAAALFEQLNGAQATGVDPALFGQQRPNTQNQLIGEVNRQAGERRETLADQVQREFEEDQRRKRAQGVMKIMQERGIDPKSRVGREMMLEAGLYEQGAIDRITPPASSAYGPDGGVRQVTPYQAINLRQKAMQLQRKADILAQNPTTQEMAQSFYDEADAILREIGDAAALPGGEAVAPQPDTTGAGVQIDPRQTIHGASRQGAQNDQFQLQMLQMLGQNPQLLQSLGEPGTPEYEAQKQKLIEMVLGGGGGG